MRGASAMGGCGGSAGHQLVLPARGLPAKRCLPALVHGHDQVPAGRT